MADPEYYSIQRAIDSQASALKNVGVDHGGFDILVAEQFLNCSNIVAILEQIGGKAVAEGVWADAFVDFGYKGGSFDGFLDNCFVQVVATSKTGFLVDIKAASREDVLRVRFLANGSIKKG